MKLWILCAALTIGASIPPATAGEPLPITDLFNTGVDEFGFPLFDNDADLHYTFALAPPTGTVPIVATESNGFPIPPWLGDNFTSAWITPSEDTTGDAGDYTYRTTFTIPEGVALDQVYIRGQFTSDNTAPAVFINDQLTGITGSGNFQAFGPFFVIQDNFVIGLNTIDFVVNEATGSVGAGGYTGLRVEMAGAYAPTGESAIPGLFDTGVNDEGIPLLDDELDTHYVLSGAASGSPFVATAGAPGSPIPPWTPDNFTSAWITPTFDTTSAPGDYFYDLTFDLTGLDPATASIYGQWATDDLAVDIYLNGAPTGSGHSNGFVNYTEFRLSAATGALFSAGLNTLTFQVTNGGVDPNPSGLRVEFLSASAVPIIPEPSSALLCLCGAMLLIRRRSA